MDTRLHHADFSASLAGHDEHRTTPWMLRLIGATLLANLVVEVVDNILVGWGPYDERLWISLLLSLPTIGLLCLTGLFLFKRSFIYSDQVLKGMLAIAMFVSMLQMVGHPIIPYIVAPRPDMTLSDAFLNGSLGGFAGSHARLQTGVVFMMIPAVLGAWISGKHHAWRWALLGVVLSAFAILLLNHRDLSGPELVPFVAEDIALVLLTLFVGSLAELDRAEQARLQQANLLMAEQAQMREQLAASRERLRMARELHDTVAHSLAGLVFQLDALGTLIGDAPECAQQALASAKETARQGLRDARMAVTDLRKDSAEDTELARALQRHVDALRTQDNPPITFEQVNCGAADMGTLNKVYSDALFRIAQEAIYNATRHAHARRIWVKLIKAYTPNSPQASLTLSVEDDGVGFDLSTMQVGHYGLRGIRERAELIGARVQMDSNAGKGTIISVVLPLKT
jgi:signal transduction histidine kinase